MMSDVVLIHKNAILLNIGEPVPQNDPTTTWQLQEEKVLPKMDLGYGTKYDYNTNASQEE